MVKLFKRNRNGEDAVALNAGLDSELSTTDGLHGLQYLADPVNPMIDIVFVHGIMGNREKTWTHPNKLLWPRDLLPHDFPNARIMTFGYDADVIKIWSKSAAGSNGLYDHGKSLAYAVSDARSGVAAKERPILFVAHSLGGLVTEQALLVCRAANEPRLKSVLQSVVGIVFMGTPHQGSDLATWGTTLAKLLHKMWHVNHNVVATLNVKSEVLAGVTQDFQQLMLTPEHVSRTRIFCFYEELPVAGVGKIVPDESAILKQYSNRSIHGNHMDMARFSGKTDNGYRAVRGVLEDWLGSIEEAARKEASFAIGLDDAQTSVPTRSSREDVQSGEETFQEEKPRGGQGEREEESDETAQKTFPQAQPQNAPSGTVINGNMSTGGGPMFVGGQISGNTFTWGKS